MPTRGLSPLPIIACVSIASNIAEGSMRSDGVRFESVETFRRWHCHTQSATDSICTLRPASHKSRRSRLCALLVPSLWLINYVLPQRGHREAQRFLELGLRPRRPRLTAEGSPKHLCAFLVPSLWLINYVLPQGGRREAQRFLELGLRPKPQTHCRR